MTHCLIHDLLFHVQCQYCRIEARTEAAALEVERWGHAWWWEVDEMECPHGVEIVKKMDCKPCYLAEWRKQNIRADGHVPSYHGDAEMTFEEIGARIGESGGSAERIFKTAIKKLRRRPQAMFLLLQLAKERHQRSESRYTSMQSEGLRGA